MKAIIPTGGRGTRMRPLTFSTNKHFIPVANKPLIFYPVETIANAGIKDIAITYNPGGIDEARSILGDGSRWGVQFTYVCQEKPIGLANIVQSCEDYISGDSFVLHLGDNIFVDGINDALDYFEREKPNGLVTMVHHKDNRRLGVPYFDENGRLLQYVEKPANPPHDFAVPGLYFADASFFSCFRGPDQIQPSARGEYEIPSAFQWMIDHGLRVDVVEYKGKWLDPGKFDDWIEANQFLLDKNVDSSQEGEVDETSHLENRVSIGKRSKVINSHLRGPIIIGEGVMIKDSYVGPYTSVSNNCTIEASHLENSVVMESVKIAHVKHPIDTSLIGTESEVVGVSSPKSTLRLFIGEKCRLEV